MSLLHFSAFLFYESCDSLINVSRGNTPLKDVSAFDLMQPLKKELVSVSLTFNLPIHVKTSVDVPRK